MLFKKYIKTPKKKKEKKCNFCGNVSLIAFLPSLAQAGSNIINFSTHFGTGQQSVLNSFHFRINNFFVCVFSFLF